MERPSRPLSGVRVLLVDDEPDTLQVLSFALELAGAQVSCLGDPSLALRAVRAGEADVLLSDLYMPVEDGLDLIRKVRALPPDKGGRIPAAVLTAHPSEENTANSLEAGYQAVVGKPIDPRALVQVVLDLKPASLP
jgi:CheY-like chemotaxis protein